jgi:hypothetical protein
MATGSDLIMMDPTNTEKIPYNTCTTWEITGNLSFNSWSGSAIINCYGNGLNFEGNSTTLEFQGLTLLDTFLRIYDASLTINNCSFGSFIQNAAFLYLIHVSVNNPLENVRIYIANTNFFDNNTVGALNVVNHQSAKVFVEVRNITVANSYVEKANYIIFFQGNVDFNFMNSEISNTKFSENISNPSLIYFYGCPVAYKREDGTSNSRLSRKLSQHGRLGDNGHGSSVFGEDPTTISFSIKGLNFSCNHAGIVETLFCTRGSVSITNTTALHNTNRWTLGGSVVIDTRYNVGRLDVLLEDSSFVSNTNEGTGPMVSVVSLNLTLFVTNCTFSHNQGGAVYISTSRGSKVTIRNTSVQFSKSFARVMSHCGAQICVMFRYQDESVKGHDSSDWPITEIGKSTKLWKGKNQSKETVFVESNINEPNNFGSTTGFSGTVGTLDQSPNSNRDGSLLEPNAPGLKVANWENSRFLKKGRSLILDNNKASKSNRKGRFESERGKINAGNSKLPTLSVLEYGEIFESGLLIEDCEFRNNTGFLSSSAALEVHSEPYISLGGDSIAHLLVRRCVFMGNVAQCGTGALYVAVNIGFNISNSTFHNNAGSASGAIYFCGTTMVIQNCTLDSNSGGYAVYTQATGSVRLTKQGTALIQESRIIQRNIFQTVSNLGTYHSSLALSSDSFDNIVLSNSVIKCQWSPSLEKVVVLEIAHTKPFVLKDGTSIECPLGYEIKRRTISESEQSFECDLCTMGSYSVDRGIYR